MDSRAPPWMPVDEKGGRGSLFAG